MRKFYSIISLSLVLVGLNVEAKTQNEAAEPITIASWDFTTSEEGVINTTKYGPNGLAPTTISSDVTVGGITRSDAVEETTANSITNELSRPVWGWRNLSSTNIGDLGTGTETFPAKYNDMVNDGKYVTFSITPKDGTTLSLSGIDAFKATGSASTVRMRMEYKVDNGEFTVFGIRTGDTTEDLPLSASSGGVTSKDVDFTEVSALQNVEAGKTITFRIIFIMNVTSATTSASGWGGFFNTYLTIKGTVTPVTYSLILNSANEEQGTVENDYTGDITAIPYGTEVELTAVAKTGYKFSKWSDENTDNPRPLIITEAMDLTAIFEVDTTVGIENSTTDKGAIVSEVYYDLTGKQVSTDTKGLILKKVTYENGSVQIVKQIQN